MPTTKGGQPQQRIEGPGVPVEGGGQMLRTEQIPIAGRTNVAGRDALDQVHQSSSSPRFQDLTVRTPNGIMEGRSFYNPATGQSFFQVDKRSPNEPPQRYEYDRRTSTLHPVNSQGQRIGEPLQFTNVRSGHAPPGMSPESFIGRAQAPAGPHDHPHRSHERPTGSPERRFTPGGPHSEHPAIQHARRFGQPEIGDKPSFDRQRFHPGGFHDGPPGRTLGRTDRALGTEYTIGSTDPNIAASRLARLQSDARRMEFAQQKVAQSRPGSDQDYAAQVIAARRADINDRISRSLSGTGHPHTCSYHAPDTYHPPMVMPQREFGPGRSHGRSWEGRVPGAEPGGRGPGSEPGRGWHNHPGRPGGGGSDNPPGSGQGQGWPGRRGENRQPGTDGVGGGQRPGGPQDRIGQPGHRGDFLPPGVKPGLDPRLEARLAQDLNSIQTRRALLDAIDKCQHGKLNPTTKEGLGMAQILKGMRPEQLVDVRTLLTNQEKRGGFQAEIGKLHVDTQKSIVDMLTLLGKTGRFTDNTEMSKNPTLRLLDLLGKPERPFDKVPTGEQSRTLLLEMTKGFGERSGRSAEMTELISRTLSNTRTDNASQLIDKTPFTLKMDGADPTVRDLVARLQSKDILISSGTRNSGGDSAVSRPNDARIDATTLSTRLQPEMLQNVRPDEISRALTGREVVSTAMEAALLGKTQQSDSPTAASSTVRFDPSQANAGDASAANINAQKIEQTIIAEAKEEEKKKRKEEEKEREERKEKEHSEAELLALMQARKLKEQKERELKEKEKSQEKDKKQQQLQKRQRTRYRVRKGDTLASIAAKLIHDDALAPLIYNLNKTAIPIMVHKGKRYADPKAGSLIWIPNDADIATYRGSPAKNTGIDFSGPQFNSAEEELAARFGNAWSGAAAKDLSDTERAMPPLDPAKAKARRENIEKYLGPMQKLEEEELDGRLRHVCRLGDSLRGIALRHPALRDVELWPLIAQINGMSMDTDAKGNPLAQISRGMTILIPSQTEIDSFQSIKIDKPSSELLRDNNESQEATGRTCPTCKRQIPGTVLICPECLSTLDSDSTTNSESSGTAAPLDATALMIEARIPGVDLVEESEPSILKEETKNELFGTLPEERQSATDIVEDLSRTARIISTGNTYDMNQGFMITLEIMVGEQWLKAVTYDFYEELGLRHEYDISGGRHTMRITLPTAQAIQLARNELTTRWPQHQARLSQ